MYTLHSRPNNDEAKASALPHWPAPVDARRGTERRFQALGPHQGSGAPQAQDVEDLAGDVDPGLGGHLLADERHREQGGQVVGPDGLARRRV
jgi:hypothetical protein